MLGLSSSSVTEDPPADTAKKPEKKKEDEKILKLKDELARLQEQETVLSHLLSLEKEQRVRAEQLVEQERLACLGWRHRLAERCGEEREEVDCAEVSELNNHKYIVSCTINCIHGLWILFCSKVDF